MLNKKQIITVLLAFMLGLIFNDAYSELSSVERPLSLFQDGIEKNSPGDWIKEDQIKVYNDKVIINLKDAEWASFTDTNSMDPVIDEKANAIEIIPKSSDNIQEGDIISYKSDYADGTIIHRIIKIGSDEEGWYCIVKGDNNQNPDPGKIRFNQIKRVLIAIIY
ncbi:hypothetical protein COY26_02680 [Candidatus Woesearchaeota archaeon CG_4_10_14_0_2_um_filter_33_10]|nr:MAG: hypothetical protein AUJ83_02850 [Candidatus Woesearchaeota archaeon CG1_02_33_12]PIN77536.1 MAG: hypothetical protein COV14_05620 [Candidatus Woesearchaeota archaeon CG10_big_fil_rev_8_21_14_0_10_33_12]PIU72346.1 MAG: hypothetical protein COS79_03415 [Candidatus Woesearchaeota archaeon CG06_land_8_20_14_3_00_33_13]PIZ53162.1 MAG: hypothetical protein COY26_02680 [Candidatus Woesearchaeota archaeon CG_4_10_14_0_2_um_filter_33_10]